MLIKKTGRTNKVFFSFKIFIRPSEFALIDISDKMEILRCLKVAEFSGSGFTFEMGLTRVSGIYNNTTRQIKSDPMLIANGIHR